MTYNSARNGEYTKKKWFAIITTLALFIFVLGLLGASVVSFFQTLYAFKPLNDPDILVFGIKAGNGLAFFFAAIFQYGQNAALFIKKHYCNGTVLVNLWVFQITDKTACDIAFWVCAVIDGGTNCIWLSKQDDVKIQPIYIQAIEYSVMILVVWVEEVLGAALQSLSHSATDLKKIIEHERSSTHQRDDNRQERTERPVPDAIRSKLPPREHSQGARTDRDVHKIQRPDGKPTPAAASRPLYNEPTYHKVNLNPDE